MFVTIAVFGKAARPVKVPSLGRSVPHSSRMLGFSCETQKLRAPIQRNSTRLFFPVQKLVPRWTLLGHSERRTKYGETDEDISGAGNSFERPKKSKSLKQFLRWNRGTCFIMLHKISTYTVLCGVRMSPRRCRKH